MWATFMYSLRVVNAYVKGHSWVSYGVGYLAQTMLKIVSPEVPGAIAIQLLISPPIESTSPPAIGSEWKEKLRILQRSCLQSYSLRTRRDISPSLWRLLKSCNSQTLRIFPSLRIVAGSK